MKILLNEEIAGNGSSQVKNSSASEFRNHDLILDEVGTVHKGG